MKFPAKIAALLALSLALPNRPGAGQTTGAAPARFVVACDLERDGRAERLVLDARRDPALAVWRGRRRLWRGVPRRWQPWKLLAADVDGDGRREIILGVHKATRYFPRPHNCLFVYGWDGRQVFPRWLGSSLSRPFTDFAFADVDRDGAEELVALETRRDGRRSVAVYSWDSFGFVLDWEQGAWRAASLVGVRAGKIVVQADGQKISLAGH